jgi:hypothetical protein
MKETIALKDETNLGLKAMEFLFCRREIIRTFNIIGSTDESE